MSNGPATTEDTGLDWVTFAEEEPGDACQFGQQACTAEATHVALYLPLSCDHDRRLYCLAHAEYIIRAAAARQAQIGVPRFYCSRCGPDTKLILLQMETF